MATKKIITDSFKQFDLFSKNSTFRENGRDSLQSIFGAFLSLIVLIFVLAYGIVRIDKLVHKKDTSYSQYIEINSISSDNFGNDELDLHFALFPFFFRQQDSGD